MPRTDDSCASDVSSSLVSGFTDPGSGSDDSDEVPIENSLGMGLKVAVRNIPPSWDIARLATAIDEIDRHIEFNHMGIQGKRAAIFVSRYGDAVKIHTALHHRLAVGYLLRVTLPCKVDDYDDTGNALKWRPRAFRTMNYVPR